MNDIFEKDLSGAMVSPEEFRQVAAGSKIKPRVAMMGKASAGP